MGRGIDGFLFQTIFLRRFAWQTALKDRDSVSPIGGQVYLPSSIIKIMSPSGAKAGRFACIIKRLGFPKLGAPQHVQYHLGPAAHPSHGTWGLEKLI